MNVALTVAAVAAGWFGIAAVALVGWALITRPAREARCQAAQDAIDARRDAIAAAMNRHPAGKDDLQPAQDALVAAFRAQVEDFDTSTLNS